MGGLKTWENLDCEDSHNFICEYLWSDFSWCWCWWWYQCWWLIMIPMLMLVIIILVMLTHGCWCWCCNWYRWFWWLWHCFDHTSISDHGASDKADPVNNYADATDAADFLWNILFQDPGISQWGGRERQYEWTNKKQPGSFHHHYKKLLFNHQYLSFKMLVSLLSHLILLKFIVIMLTKGFVVLIMIYSPFCQQLLSVFFLLQISIK